MTMIVRKTVQKQSDFYIVSNAYLSFVNYLQHPFVTGDDEDPVLHASVMVSIFKVYSCIIQILIIVICILMY